MHVQSQARVRRVELNINRVDVFVYLNILPNEMRIRDNISCTSACFLHLIHTDLHTEQLIRNILFLSLRSALSFFSTNTICTNYSTLHVYLMTTSTVPRSLLSELKRYPLNTIRCLNII